MKISYNWLKEYVDVKLPPEKLATLLTMAGLSVESFERTGDDHIFEIEITSNRPDWLSYIGVAREVAALTGRRLRLPAAKLPKAPQSKSPGPVTVTVAEKALCPRYTGRVITGVTVGSSPDWLKARIEAMGLRSVNNIVDVTNFCLFETGEPMHAFDLDTLSGGRVIVRRAKKGEKIVAIDGVERALDESMLVIADDARAVAVAGVMGGLATEVTAATKRILLEAASFDQVSVRRTARKLALPTESSYRFERRVDIEAIAPASDRATQLILETAGGAAGAFIDTGTKHGVKKTVTLRYGRMNKVLGTDITPAEAKRILVSLGLAAKASSKERASFTVPSFRYDLQHEVDLIEEIARIYGYEKMGETVPPLVEQPVRKGPDMLVEAKVRSVLAGLGMDEIITYTLMGKPLLERSRIDTADVAVIRNPLTSEQEAMRPSLLPGVLTAIGWNLNRKAKDLKLFEIGNVYRREGDHFIEEPRLAVGLTGAAHANWLDGTRPAGYFDLKGALEALLAALGIRGAAFRATENARFTPEGCFAIDIAGTTIGVAGEVVAAVREAYDIPERAYFLEVDLIPLVEKAAFLERRFRELPRYPSVVRDISVLVGREAAGADMVAAMEAAAGAILAGVSLVDRYTGKQVPEGKVSLTYRLEYRDPQKTLEEKDIAGVHTAVLKALEEAFGAKLR